MGFYNNSREQDYIAQLYRSLGIYDDQKMSELSGEAFAAIAAGSVYAAPSRHAGGYRYEVRYPNGFAASIIKNFGSYGGECDLWEVAVLRRDEEDVWQLCYDTPITDDVLGWLSEERVIEACNQIRAL